MSSTAITSAVTIVGGPPVTSPRVPWTWTYQHEGRTYDGVRVKRLTVAEVRALMAAQRAAEASDPDASLPLPIYVDEEGAPIPQVVMNGLMDDDLAATERVAADFFPARFRTTPADSSSASGDATEPTSSE
nr:hypothetical protein NG677_20105 [Methylobacterium sp. OTU13CASTA1]